MDQSLEAVLQRAVVDPYFREDLLTRRSAAVRVPLSPTARAVLDSIPRAQLEGMIAGLPAAPLPFPDGRVPGPSSMGVRPDTPGISRGIRPGIPIAVAVGAVIAGGAAAATCASMGHRVDLSPAPVQAAPDGSTPDGTDGGVPGKQP